MLAYFAILEIFFMFSNKLNATFKKDDFENSWNLENLAQNTLGQKFLNLRNKKKNKKPAIFKKKYLKNPGKTCFF